jgi:hypothetical protein
VASLVAALAIVFFFAPILTLPLAVAFQPSACGSGWTLCSMNGVSVSRVVSPSCLLFGFGEVRYEAHYGLAQPFNFTTPGFYRFSWNYSDLRQYWGSLIFQFH